MFKKIISVILSSILFVSSFYGCSLKNNEDKNNSSSSISEQDDGDEDENNSSSSSEQNDGYEDDTETTEEDKVYLLSTIVALSDILTDGYISMDELTSMSKVQRNIYNKTSYGQANQKIANDIIIIIGQLGKVGMLMDDGLDASNESKIVTTNLEICLNNFYLKNYKTKNFSIIVSTTEELLGRKITFDPNSKFENIIKFDLQ